MSLDDDQHVVFEGIVVFDTKGCFKVRLDNGEEVNAKPCGKMRKNKIQIITGDVVEVKVSIYDMTNGFIIRRVTSGNKKSAIKTKESNPANQKEKLWK